MKQSMRWSVSLGIGAFLSLSPTGFTQGLSPAMAQHMETPQKHVRTIGMDEYRKLVDHPGSALIVDVREPQEFAAGHIPGAINIPRGLINSQIWNHVGAPEKADMEKPIILQCQTGRRATLAAQTLQELGFTHTTAVIMNLDDWQKSGHPFAK